MVIKNLSRLLKSLNATHKGAYHLCMNSLHGFCTTWIGNKHHEHCSSNGHITVKIPSEKEKWLKLYDDQYKFQFPFMLDADFESILKPVDELYRENMNEMTTERKDNPLYTEKMHTQQGCIWRCSWPIENVLW